VVIPNGCHIGLARHLAQRARQHPRLELLLEPELSIVCFRYAAADLARAGIRAGDLLVATEGGAKTIDIRCTAACAIRYVAAGPAIAHAEGHIVFASS